jgi:hypothetical protein
VSHLVKTEKTYSNFLRILALAIALRQFSLKQLFANSPETFHRQSIRSRVTDIRIAALLTDYFCQKEVGSRFNLMSI